MTSIGNHMKLSVHKSIRERVRTFYLNVLKCTSMPAPAPDLDLFLFANGFVVGVFFGEEADVLSGKDHLKAAWLEIKAKDVQDTKRRLVEFGVTEVDYPDKTRFYFQAPGGQVFRLAPEDGGIYI